MRIDCSNPFEIGRMELRRAMRDGGTDVVTLEGYAAKFNVQSQLMFDFREVIAPGAFDDVLQDDVRALFNHDPNMLLGRVASGTLRLNLDATGLSYAVDLPDTDYARNLAASVDRGDVTQSSFAFVVKEATWTEVGDGRTWLRTITRFDRLFDVSPVTYPAYPDATVALRSGFVPQQVDARAAAAAALAGEQRQRVANARRRSLTLIGA